MSKNKIIIGLLIMLSIGIISLYTTFGYQTENTINEQSNSDYNLTYPLKISTDKEIVVNAKEEKFIDINLKNIYTSTIKYGMYYDLINPNKLPNNVTITLAEDSEDLLEDIIKPEGTRTISIKIKNESEYDVKLIIGALAGFENGNIEDLITDDKILIK